MTQKGRDDQGKSVMAKEMSEASMAWKVDEWEDNFVSNSNIC